MITDELLDNLTVQFHTAVNDVRADLARLPAKTWISLAMGEPVTFPVPASLPLHTEDGEVLPETISILRAALGHRDKLHVSIKSPKLKTGMRQEPRDKYRVVVRFAPRA